MGLPHHLYFRTGRESFPSSSSSHIHTRVGEAGGFLLAPGHFEAATPPLVLAHNWVTSGRVTCTQIQRTKLRASAPFGPLRPKRGCGLRWPSGLGRAKRGPTIYTLRVMCIAETRQHIPLITREHWLFISSYCQKTYYFPFSVGKNLLTFPRSESSYQTGRLLLYTGSTM